MNKLPGLIPNLASTHQTETSEANWHKQFSEAGEDKQLLLAIVVCLFYCCISITTLPLFLPLSTYS